MLSNCPLVGAFLIHEQKIIVQPSYSKTLAIEKCLYQFESV